MRRYVLAAVAILAGCGGESGAKPGVSGVDSESPIASLSASEQQQLCDYTRDEAAEIRPTMCLLIGAMAAGMGAAFNSPTSDAEVQAMCEDAYQQCVDGETTTSGSCTAQGNDCQATVAEYEACVAETVAVFQKLQEYLPECSTFTVADIHMGEDASEVELTPEQEEMQALLSTPLQSCVLIEEKCPGFMTDSGAEDAEDSTSSELFDCADGETSISADLVCNSEADCLDGSDEEGCMDTLLYFACADGHRAVSNFFVCDGSEECLDGSDEASCVDWEFQCVDGDGSVATGYVCNGSEECADGSDEASCVNWLFECADGMQQFPFDLVCDGIEECLDGSDEADCG